MAFEIGIMTFGELTEDVATSALPSPRRRVRETIEQGQIADEAGLDVFGLGEHHRSDFVGSAPTILLAAAAERTKDIRLTSTVTVLGSADPVRADAGRLGPSDVGRLIPAGDGGVVSELQPKGSQGK